MSIDEAHGFHHDLWLRELREVCPAMMYSRACPWMLAVCFGGRGFMLEGDVGLGFTPRSTPSNILSGQPNPSPPPKNP
jgi:hypothetical protein